MTSFLKEVSKRILYEPEYLDLKLINESIEKACFGETPFESFTEFWSEFDGDISEVLSSLTVKFCVKDTLNNSLENLFDLPCNSEILMMEYVIYFTDKLVISQYASFENFCREIQILSQVKTLFNIVHCFRTNKRTKNDVLFLFNISNQLNVMSTMFLDEIRWYSLREFLSSFNSVHSTLKFLEFLIETNLVNVRYYDHIRNFYGINRLTSLETFIMLGQFHTFDTVEFQEKLEKRYSEILLQQNFYSVRNKSFTDILQLLEKAKDILLNEGEFSDLIRRMITKLFNVPQHRISLKEFFSLLRLTNWNEAAIAEIFQQYFAEIMRAYMYEFHLDVINYLSLKKRSLYGKKIVKIYEEAMSFNLTANEKDILQSSRLFDSFIL